MPNEHANQNANKYKARPTIEELYPERIKPNEVVIPMEEVSIVDIANEIISKADEIKILAVK